MGRRAVSDTPTEVMGRYRAMLLARSPAERLKGGCSMGATARALVRASVLAQDPNASPTDVRHALFLRFYGNEFDAAERERIMERLGRDEPDSRGSLRRVRVDWDDLEMALTSNPGEWTYYLDLRTGEVQMVPVDRLSDDEDWPSEEEIDDAGSRVEYGWMEARGFQAVQERTARFPRGARALVRVPGRAAACGGARVAQGAGNHADDGTAGVTVMVSSAG
jgi:hypothetical protein